MKGMALGGVATIYLPSVELFANESISEGRERAKDGMSSFFRAIPLPMATGGAMPTPTIFWVMVTSSALAVGWVPIILKRSMFFTTGASAATG